MKITISKNRIDSIVKKHLKQLSNAVVESAPKDDLISLLTDLSYQQVNVLHDKILKSIKEMNWDGNVRMYLSKIQDIRTAKERGVSGVGRDAERSIQALIHFIIDYPSDTELMISFVDSILKNKNHSANKAEASLGEDRDDIIDNLVSARNSILEASDKIYDAYKYLGPVSSSEAETLKNEIMDVVDGESSSVAVKLQSMIKRLNMSKLPYKD